MRRHLIFASLTLALHAARARGAPQAPPAAEPIQELVAAVPERGADPAAWERQLDAISAASHRVAMRPQASYDPVARSFRIRVPEEVSVEELPGAPAGQKSMRSHRIAPAGKEQLGLLEVASQPSEAPHLADDLQLLVDFKVARVLGPKGERISPVTRSTVRHVATKKEPWRGTLEVVTLAVTLERATLVRASTGAVLAERAAGEPVPSAAAETAKTRGPAAPRKSIDRYGRAGSQWTMKEQMNFMSLCFTRFPDARDKLDVQRRCRCVMELMQLRHPKTPPQRIDSKEDEELIGRCSPTAPAR